MSRQDDALSDRKYPRVKESCDLKFHVIADAEPPAERQGGTAVNISGGGMCFSSDHEVEPGVMIAVEMKLSHLPTPVVSLGRVVWCERAQGTAGFDVGVEFWWIGWSDEAAQSKMLKYVNEKLDELGIDDTGQPS